MTPPRWLFVAVMATLLCWLAMGLERVGLLPAVFSGAVRENADDLFSKAGRLNRTPAFAPLVVILADQADWDARVDTARRSPPVQAFDRVVIANLLNTVLDAPAPPAMVVLDIDVAPIAPEADEAVLRQALERWRSAPRAPPLLMIRSEDCGEPAGRAAGVQNLRRWHDTPYDDLLSPTATSATRLGWACSIPAPTVDGAVRLFHQYGCALREGRPFGLSSLGWIVEQFTRSGGGQLGPAWTSDFYRDAAPDLLAACNGAEREARPPEPVVKARGRAGSAAEEPAVIGLSAMLAQPRKTVGALAGAVVVIGQDTRRAPDHFRAYWDSPISGAILIAAHLDTTVRYMNAPRWPAWANILLSPVLSLAASLMFAACAWLRDKLSEKQPVFGLRHWPKQQGGGASSVAALALTNSTVTGILSAVACAWPLAALAAWFAPIGAWPGIAMVLLSVTIVSILVDVMGAKEKP